MNSHITTIDATRHRSAAPCGTCHRPDRSSETARVESPYRMQWFAFRTRTRSEFTAMSALCERGLFAFAPVEFRTRRDGPRRRPGHARVAMMPGYVFAKLADGYQVKRLQAKEAHASALGMIRSVVRINGEPAPIADGDVARLLSASGRVVDGMARVLVRRGRKLCVALRPLTDAPWQECHT